MRFARSWYNRHSDSNSFSFTCRRGHEREAGKRESARASISSDVRPTLRILFSAMVARTLSLTFVCFPPSRLPRQKKNMRSRKHTLTIARCAPAAKLFRSGLSLIIIIITITIIISNNIKKENEWTWFIANCGYLIFIFFFQFIVEY